MICKGCSQAFATLDRCLYCDGHYCTNCIDAHEEDCDVADDYPDDEDDDDWDEDDDSWLEDEEED